MGADARARPQGRAVEDTLTWATRCAEASGVTRLAELTRLDGLDLPVFQAVRPWSRALCVHQGKARDRRIAAVGALMEAVESHSAESFDGPTFEATLSDLGSEAPSAHADDFAVRRGELGPQSQVRWTRARRLRDGGRTWAPWWGVSLNLTEIGDARVERSSNGLSAAFDLDDARRRAFCELLERDAVVEWRAAAPIDRALDQVLAAPDPGGWLARFTARARERGVHLTLYAFPSLIGWPVAVAVLDEPGAGRRLRGRVFGSACRPDKDEAIEAAVCEAAQSRLTAISAVRDDILPPGSAIGLDPLGLAPPLPPGVSPRSRLPIGDAAKAISIADATACLEGRGLGSLIEVELAAPGPAVVVKLFAPGLAMGDRRRREPSP